MSTLEAPGGVDAPEDDVEGSVDDDAIGAPIDLDVDPDGPDDVVDEPPVDDGALRRGIDIVVVAACALFVFWQLHPSLILDDSTPAGGDMGAHVWAFAYLRDVLLPSFRLSGWTPDWYAGFPVFQFYMVVPFLGMVALNAGLSGVASVVPAGLSLAVSARLAGLRDVRRVAMVLVAAGVVTAGIGALSGFGEAFRFTILVAAVAAAVVAYQRSSESYRRLLLLAAIGIALLGIALPYGTSFKLVTVAGVVAMPVSAYLFGRLSRLPYPTPALLSVATLGFLFDKNFTIYGGNAASTMAGEFAFSISLALAIAYLGVLVHGLRTGTHRATAAVLLALVGLCHLIPAFFALGATAVLLLVHVVDEHPVRGTRAWRADVAAFVALLAVVLVAAGVLLTDTATLPPTVAVAAVASTMVVILWWSRTGPADPEGADGWFGAARSWWLMSTGAVSALLAAWWVLPFFWQRTYLNDMGWEKIAVHRQGTAIWTWFTDSVWPELVPGDLRLVAALALVGAVLSLVFRNRIGTALVVLGLGLATAFVFAPQGRLWNARLLPFWYLVLYFLAALGVGEVVRAVAQLASGRPDRPERRIQWVAAPLLLLLVSGFLGGQLRNVPGGRTVPGDGVNPERYEILGFLPDVLSPDVEGRNFVTDWSRWNYSGYEGKAAYPEYRDIVATMADVGRTNGCGMSLWEYSSDLNDYGTPMALMLLPHWTDGCIGSMEGLYFEASSTTPFHFLMQSELSAGPSRAQRDLPYRDLDMNAGVDHLQLMGVRYYMGRSAQANAAASVHPDLTEIASSGPWVVYEVADAPMVEPLAFEPAVTTASGHQDEWLCGGEDEFGRCTGAALDWFQDTSAQDVALAASGPSAWQRVDPGQESSRRPVEPAVVSEVETGRDGISFTVDRVGSPVLVKQSYFPNWRVEGADGPYRVAPNLMVVVPTSNEVRMTYGREPVDYAAIALTVVGIALAFGLARSRRVAVPELRDVAET